MTIFGGVAVFLITSMFALADTGFDARVRASQAEVVRRWPAAGIAGTAFHTRFKAEYEHCKISERELFELDYWPEILALRAVKRLSSPNDATIQDRLEAARAETAAHQAIALGPAPSVRVAVRNSASQLPPMEELPEDVRPGVPLDQLAHRGDWAETFAGSDTNSAQRQRHNRDITEYGMALVKERLKKARALALEYEELTGQQITLAENEPAKLAAQIKGMEATIAKVRNKQLLEDAAEARAEQRAAADEWWEREQQAEQFRRQKNEIDRQRQELDELKSKLRR